MDALNAGILVTDGSNVLLAKRNCRPNVNFPGHWSPFAGAVEDGETPMEAAIRELFEESKIEPKGKVTFLKKISRKNRSDFYLYLLTVEKIPFPVLDFEHTEWGIFRINAIDFSPEPIDGDIVRCIKSIQKTPKP